MRLGKFSAAGLLLLTALAVRARYPDDDSVSPTPRKGIAHMTDPIQLVAVIGSLRKGSLNRIVFEAATELVPEGSTLAEVPVADVPFFDGDLEGDDEPAAVVALKDAVRRADGLLFFTPEYNLSVPAVTKNALDWLSRPFGEGAISGTPTSIVAASPGGRGGQGVRESLGLSASILTDRWYPDTLGIGSVGDAISNGRLTDPDVRATLTEWLDRFVAHARGEEVAAS